MSVPAILADATVSLANIEPTIACIDAPENAPLMLRRSFGNPRPAICFASCPVDCQRHIASLVVQHIQRTMAGRTVSISWRTIHISKLHQHIASDPGARTVQHIASDPGARTSASRHRTVQPSIPGLTSAFSRAIRALGLSNISPERSGLGLSKLFARVIRSGCQHSQRSRHIGLSTLRVPCARQGNQQSASVHPIKSSISVNPRFAMKGRLDQVTHDEARPGPLIVFIQAHVPISPVPFAVPFDKSVNMSNKAYKSRVAVDFLSKLAPRSFCPSIAWSKLFGASISCAAKAMPTATIGFMARNRAIVMSPVTGA